MISAIDTGQWSYQDGAQVAKQRQNVVQLVMNHLQESSPYNCVRINNGVDVFFKLYSIREI